MTLSIVTISFNQAAFLERAIRSVLDQKTAQIEYILLDPGSTDGSRDIVARHAGRIDQVVLDPDTGPANALNRGLALATGEYFAYLNSDDEYLPGALGEALDHLAADPARDVLYGSAWLVDAAGRRLKHLIPDRRFTAPLYARGLATIVQQASFMRTATLRAAGGFNEANRTSWDGEAFFEMARRGATFRRVDRDWALFRVHGASITGSQALTAHYHADQARIFARQFGRPPGPADAALHRVLRLANQAADPLGTMRKLRSRLPGASAPIPRAARDGVAA